MGERRLLAIVFTDIVGYSSMMAADEARTVRAVQEHQALVRARLVDYGGQERRTVGDAFLLTFDSAAAALRWAIELQETFRRRNEALPQADRIWLRIGLHVGEVLLEDRELHGDAVNLAARVEPQASPGGVAFTDAVMAQVRDVLVDRKVKSLGRVRLKNIASPPVLYDVQIEFGLDSRARRGHHHVYREGLKRGDGGTGESCAADDVQCLVRRRVDGRDPGRARAW